MKKLLCLLLLMPFQAFAALYGSIQGPTSTLVELDETTGALIATIGDIGYRINGMSMDPTTGIMYASTATGDASFPNGLITVDLTTGAGTPVGAGAGQLVNVITFNSAGDLFGWTEDSDDAVTWDKAAGTVTVLGPSGLSSAEQSLSFDGTDTLYYVSACCGGIQIIDTATGATTPGPAITGNTGGALHHGVFQPGSSILWAITESGGSNNPRAIDRIDVTTGAVLDTLVAPDSLHTLAFATTTSSPAAVPVMPLWLLGIAAGLLGLAGHRSARRLA